MPNLLEPSLMPPQSLSIRTFSIASASVFILFVILGYFLYDARQSVARFELRLEQLDQKANEANSSIAQANRLISLANSSISQANKSISLLESSTAQTDREIRGQLAVIRVALEQTTTIKIDGSGAMISRKNYKSNGIDLR